MRTGAATVAGRGKHAAEKAPSEGALGASESVANPPGTTKRGQMICGLTDACTKNRGGVGGLAGWV